MKHRNRLLTAVAGMLLPATILVWCCTKPTKDFVINVNADILSYTATLQFADATQTGAVPAGLSVSIDGDDDTAIYDYSGSKTPKLSNGMLTVGVSPQYNPTGNTVSFSVKASAPNYLPVNIPVTITRTTRNQNFLVQMINLNKTPEGIVAVQPVAAISNGVAVTPVTAATPANAGATAGITLPAGTQFRDASGHVSTGSSVKMMPAAFDPAQPVAMQALPGGQVQPAVTGGPSPAVFFLPAGFATITMSVNNTEVRQFNTPVTIQMGVNANTFNPATNTTIKAGDLLDVYSYQVTTGAWTYESATTVTTIAGKPAVNFTTNHLTTFLANVRSAVSPCTASPVLVFHAPAINSNSSDQFIIDIYPTGTGNDPAPVFSQYLTLHDKDSLALSALPAGTVKVRVTKVDYDHYLLNEYKNRGATVGELTANLCAADRAAVVEINYTPGTYLTGTGIAICQNDNTKKFLPPNGAQLYYRKAATKDDYRILGVVVKAAISTSQLVTGQRYDFKGNYGGRQIGKNNILVTQGRSFLDTTYLLTNNSSLCQ